VIRTSSSLLEPVCILPQFEHFFAQEVLELYLTGLRLAGLPEK